MRIAIPIWEDKVSPVLDTALRLLVVEVEYHREVSRFIYNIDEQDLIRRCLRIRNFNIDTLICGAVSRPFVCILLASGVDVIQEISGRAEEVLKAYLHGNLFCSRFLMPGCRRNRFRPGDRYSPKIDKEEVIG